MKKLLPALFFLATISVSLAQSKQTRDVPTFSSVSFGVAGKCYLRQGSPQKVVIEGKDDILNELETEVRGDKLMIRMPAKWFDWGWHGNDHITVYITMENIDGLSVSGSGDLIAETAITTENIDLNVSGSGSLEAEVQASGDMDTSVSGSGDLIIKGKCRNFDTDVSGSGKVAMDGTISERARFGVSGSGKVDARGKAQYVKTSISGSGRVLAANLQTDKCEVRISGSGDVEINVISELDANISGSGSVTYTGNPSHVNSHSSGSGSVRKR